VNQPRVREHPTHALVVGGSGMLAGLCQCLAEDGWQVSVIGRDSAKLSRATDINQRLHPLSVDYEQIGAFQTSLSAITDATGPITLAICWIRSWAAHSLITTAAAVAPEGRLITSQAAKTATVRIKQPQN